MVIRMVEITHRKTNDRLPLLSGRYASEKAEMTTEKMYATNIGLSPLLQNANI